MRLTLASLLLITSSLTAEADIPKLRTSAYEVATPEGWLSRSWNEPGTGHVTIFVPKNDAPAFCILHMREVDNFEPYDSHDLEEWLKERSAPFAAQSVEKSTTLRRLEIPNGFGVYCAFTDASLAGKPHQRDAYKVIALAAIRWGDDLIADATIFCEDQNAPEFRVMLKALSSVKVTKKPN